MFRHKMCHPQGSCFVTLPKHISTIAAFVMERFCSGVNHTEPEASLLSHQTPTSTLCEVAVYI